MSEDKKYNNVIITGIWPTRNGHFNTMALDARAFDKLTQVAEIGGKLLIRKRTEESISKAKNPETAAPYYLEFVPKSEVDAYKESRKTSSGL